MGNDGGSIPTRRELVKEAARNPSTTQIKEARLEQQEYGWTTDPISKQPLTRPVVSDAAGKLYNKSTVLEYLVEGTYAEEAEAAFGGAVKGLKDIVEVHFELKDSDAAKGDDSETYENWKCPVTGEKLGPGSKAVYLAGCGHTFSGIAIREVSGEKCLTCDTEYASNDIISILPTQETEIARLQLRLKTLQEKGLTHSLKKASGSKKRKKRDELSKDAKSTSTVEAGVNGKEDKDAKFSTQCALNRINNTSTASLTAKVLEEQHIKKRRKENDNVKSLFSSRDQTKPLGKSADFMTRGYSMPSQTKR